MLNNSKASMSMIAYIYASMMGGKLKNEGISGGITGRGVFNPGGNTSNAGIFHSGAILRARKMNNRGKIIRRRRSMKIK